MRIMGAPVAAVTESEAIQAMLDAAADRRGYWAITANLDHLRRYCHEPLAKELMDSADLVVADGTPLVWASQLAGTSLPERVAGSNMIWSICEAAGNQGQSVFLLGGAPGVADRAASTLCERYPNLKIVGTLCPPMGFEADEQELRRICDHLTRTAPQIVLVALGFPKQDILIRHLRPFLPHAAFMGVGISLSFVTGEVQRAPRWTHRLGLEWLYRLSREPGRLARRYLRDGLPFAIRMLGSAAHHRVRPGGSSQSRTWGYCEETSISLVSAPANQPGTDIR
jgi:N-acetylglucosaminyldiphosphoundecaprenol N-acetyl-beta-D-mannosaminyltransferase